MLEKKGKGLNVKRLRTVCFMEADFTHNNKKLVRGIMKCAELNKVLPREQYGIRKNKWDIDQVIYKQLLYDIINLQRCPSLLYSNDAQLWYYRIVYSIASLVLQRLGIPIQLVRCMLVTIQELKHHVRTSFGTSDSTLFNDSDTPFQRICQGNGAGPTIWMAVSTPLIKMMRSARHDLKLEVPLTHVNDKFAGFCIR